MIVWGAVIVIVQCAPNYPHDHPKGYQQLLEKRQSGLQLQSSMRRLRHADSTAGDNGGGGIRTAGLDQRLNFGCKVAGLEVKGLDLCLG